MSSIRTRSNGKRPAEGMAVSKKSKRTRRAGANGAASAVAEPSVVDSNVAKSDDSSAPSDAEKASTEPPVDVVDPNAADDSSAHSDVEKAATDDSVATEAPNDAPKAGCVADEDDAAGDDHQQLNRMRAVEATSEEAVVALVERSDPEAPFIIDRNTTTDDARRMLDESIRRVRAHVRNRPANAQCVNFSRYGAAGSGAMVIGASTGAVGDGSAVFGRDGAALGVGAIAGGGASARGVGSVQVAVDAQQHIVDMVLVHRVVVQEALNM